MKYKDDNKEVRAKQKAWTAVGERAVMSQKASSESQIAKWVNTDHGEAWQKFKDPPD